MTEAYMHEFVRNILESSKEQNLCCSMIAKEHRKIDWLIDGVLDTRQGKQLIKKTTNENSTTRIAHFRYTKNRYHEKQIEITHQSCLHFQPERHHQRTENPRQSSAEASYLLGYCAMH